VRRRWGRGVPLYFVVAPLFFVDLGCYFEDCFLGCGSAEVFFVWGKGIVRFPCIVFFFFPLGVASGVSFLPPAYNVDMNEPARPSLNASHRERDFLVEPFTHDGPFWRSIGRIASGPSVAKKIRF